MATNTSRMMLFQSPHQNMRPVSSSAHQPRKVRSTAASEGVSAFGSLLTARIYDDHWALHRRIYDRRHGVDIGPSMSYAWPNGDSLAFELDGFA